MMAARVKQLRTFMTDAERKLWYALRSRGLNAKFRRQVPLGHYVVDFVSFDAKLIVEVDGGQHATSTTDQERDRYFVDRGYHVLRFWNNDVLANLDAVVETISASISPSPGARLRRAPPSPSKGRGYTERGA